MKTITFIGISLAALFLVFLCVDCSVGRDQFIESIVRDHQHDAAWTETVTSIDSEGAVSIHTVYHPDEWRLTCSELAGEQSFNIDAGYSAYQSITNGQIVTIRTRRGRWTSWHYLNSISL